MRDYLAEMLDMQDTLNSRFGMGIKHIKDKGLLDKLKIIDLYTKAAMGELIEVEHALGPEFFKWWKDREINITEVQEEITDVLFFCLCLLITSGLDTPEKIFKSYLDKWTKNNNRTDWTINQQNKGVLNE